MFATVQKWGNSQGIRLPKALLETLGIRENDRVELVQAEDAITIKKISTPQHRTLEDRLTAFYGKPIEEIDRIQGDGELEWGRAEGGEVW